MGIIQRQGLINTIILYTGVGLGFISQIIIQPHFLKPEEVGLVRVIINFGSFLTPFLLVGSSNMCVRYFPAFRDPEKKHHGFFGFMLMLATGGILLGGVIIFFLRGWLKARYVDESPLFVNYFSWAFPLAAVMSYSIAINVYTYSLFKSVVPSFLNDIWVRVVMIVSMLLYSFGWISLDIFVVSIWVAYFSQLFFLLVYVFRIDRPSFKIDWPFFKSFGLYPIFRYSFLLMLTSLSSLSMKFLDSIMIGAYLPLSFVGVFSIGAFIAQFIETPLYSLERIAGTKIASAFRHNNTQEIREIYYRSVRYLFLMGGFLAVGVITNVFDFVRLLPLEYRGAANITIIMSVGSIINMATGVNSPILNNSSRYIWSMVFVLFLLVMSVLLNMIFIPRYGIEGAAIATGLASVLYNLMKFVYIWKKFDLQPYDYRSLKTILVIGLSLAAGLLIPYPANPWFAIALRGTCVAAVYLGMTALLNIVPEYHEIVRRRLFFWRRNQD